MRLLIGANAFVVEGEGERVRPHVFREKTLPLCSPVSSYNPPVLSARSSESSRNLSSLMDPLKATTTNQLECTRVKDVNSRVITVDIVWLHITRLQKG